MKTPPLAGPAVRIVSALLLCAICFQAGRSYEELSSLAADRTGADPGVEMVGGAPAGPQAPAPETAPAPTAAPGGPLDAPRDLITPLNVRDPSSLVMGVGHYHPACPEPEAEPRVKEVKPRKLKEGRLLELLKKAEKDAPQPKRY